MEEEEERKKRFKLVHSKDFYRGRRKRGKKEGETEIRTRGINLTQGMEFRDKISRSLKFYGGCFCLLSPGGTLTLWRFPSEILKQPLKAWSISKNCDRIYIFIYKLNIFLHEASIRADLILNRILWKFLQWNRWYFENFRAIHWKNDRMKRYVKLKGNGKIKCKEAGDSFWFRPIRIQYTLSRVSR